MTDRLRQIIVAGHAGDVATARSGLADDDAGIRAAALGALARCDSLTDEDVTDGLTDADPGVRRRAVELAAHHQGVSLLSSLADPHADVVEAAAWACGEQQESASVPDRVVVTRLAELAVDAEDPLVREAATAALGAIGDPAGLAAILHACTDKPHVRRRAVLALAPFDGPDVEAAIEHALNDRDWQVRQAAEDLHRATAPHRT